MSLTIGRTFLQTQLPSILAKRFRGKINIQRPRAPHYDRARVLAVTAPIVPELPKNHKCLKPVEKEAKLENPYERIIARDIFNWFENSKFVGICHVNSITAEDMFKVKVAFHKLNMTIKSHGRSIMNLALTGTKYENTLPLYHAQFCLIFSQEEKGLNQTLKLLKKNHQIILLAGILQDRIMSRTELVNYAALPDLQTCQAQVVQVLQSAGNCIVSDLEAHSKQLVNILDAHHSNLSPKEE